MEFHEKIKKLRNDLNLTQPQVADYIEITYQNYQLLEYGKSKPSFDTLVKLCRCLNASADYLLGLKDFNER
ncbi:MAG: helix-turn-helix domain-containing protein [Oscillospiraceae bacterium]|nr:helix-turn-helix domain-containing protein [Oscillospiraceae bacterium]